MCAQSSVGVSCMMCSATRGCDRPRGHMCCRYYSIMTFCVIILTIRDELVALLSSGEDLRWRSKCVLQPYAMILINNGRCARDASHDAARPPTSLFCVRTRRMHPRGRSAQVVSHAALELSAGERPRHKPRPSAAATRSASLELARRCRRAQGLPAMSVSSSGRVGSPA